MLSPSNGFSSSWPGCCYTKYSIFGVLFVTLIIMHHKPFEYSSLFLYLSRAFWQTKGVKLHVRSRQTKWKLMSRRYVRNVGVGTPGGGIWRAWWCMQLILICLTVEIPLCWSHIKSSPLFVAFTDLSRDNHDIDGAEKKEYSLSYRASNRPRRHYWGVGKKIGRKKQKNIPNVSKTLKLLRMQDGYIKKMIHSCTSLLFATCA